jgi:hypothetical protein
MNKCISIITALFCVGVIYCADFSPVAQAQKDSIMIDSATKFDAPIAQCVVDYQGKFTAEGTLTVSSGSVSLAMWTRVDGKFYFTKIPTLQNVKSNEGIPFKMPFDSGEKKADLVLITATTEDAGKFTLTNLTHKK